MNPTSGAIMTSGISLVVASLALAVSILTAWLTLVRKGTVELSRPTVLYIGSDGSPTGPNGKPKVHLRALLYCTAKRGRVVEALYARLSRNDTSHVFSVWVYGDKSLLRGSGLFIGPEGMATGHHFLLPRDDTAFHYLPGRYRLEIIAKLSRSEQRKVLFEQELELTDSDIAALNRGDSGVYFDWSPSTGRFISHVSVIQPLTFPPLTEGPGPS